MTDEAVAGMRLQYPRDCEEQVATYDRNHMLHVLRNPYSWDEDKLRKVRLWAANELERLWALEDQLRHLVQPAIIETTE